MTLDELDEAWTFLNEREKTIIRKRFGLNGSKPETLRSVGIGLGITNERVRTLQNIALSKLRRVGMHFEKYGEIRRDLLRDPAPKIARPKPLKRKPRKPKPLPKPPRRTDTERLDWLERWIWGSAMVIRKDYGDGLSLYRGNDSQLSGANLRELLDLILFKNVSPENK